MDPYENAFVSLSPADWFGITLRQSAEVSSLRSDPKGLYPGVDLKLRVMEEGKWRPEMAVGINSALGHRHMAGEYLAFSKRYNDFDFTGGLGWGRYGTSGMFNNPLNAFGNHFNDRRDIQGPIANGPGDWFTGNDMGLFGGVEYTTPLAGLSLKLDYNSDRYAAERQGSDYKPLSPWSFGLNYAPKPWVNFGIAAAGARKVMATLSLKGNFGQWFGRNSPESAPQPMNRVRTDNTSTGAMASDSAKYNGTILHDLRRTASSVWGKLDTIEGDPIPQQVGRAARSMSNHAGKDTEELIITPGFLGLTGPNVRIMRRDMERAGQNQGSPQEVWRHGSVNAPIPDGLKGTTVDIDRFGNGTNGHPIPQFKFILDTQLSLSEEDSGVLYSTGVVGEVKQRLSEHWMAGGGLRLNAAQNYSRLQNFRQPASFPVRSDASQFAGKTVTLDRLYNGYLRSFAGGTVHVMAAGGYLEEMYSGIGGEVLWRPAGKTYALGADLWEGLRRDPLSPMALMLNGDHVLSGHLNAWYEIPDTDLTLGVQAGRYLGQDWGGQLSLSKYMLNGVKFSAFMTATDHADFNEFGGTTHIYSGIRLTLPLGNVTKYIPRGSEARLTIAPVGRDFGQSIDSPLPLYEMTQPFSTRAMMQNWNGVTE
ncbi:MAG: hypothetical protein JWO78_239 [Micavibrio sp.]|nr:hypothetical protein [Micavibrio sp.]